MTLINTEQYKQRNREENRKASDRVEAIAEFPGKHNPTDNLRAQARTAKADYQRNASSMLG
jgi:hypothetical protein